jgi:hypothetical protein
MLHADHSPLIALCAAQVNLQAGVMQTGMMSGCGSVLWMVIRALP